MSICVICNKEFKRIGEAGSPKTCSGICSNILKKKTRELNYFKNRQHNLEYKKKWRLNNKEKVLEQKKRHREKYGAELAKKQKLRYHTRKKQYLDSCRHYMYNKRNDIEFRINLRLLAQVSMLRKKYQKEYGERFNFKISKDLLNKIILKLGTPNSIDNLQIDHIIPISAFNLLDENQFFECYSPKNLQWLTISENASKQNKIFWTGQKLLPKL